MPQRPRSSSSPARNRRPGCESQSTRSNGDRESKGVGIDEYRHAGIHIPRGGSKRSRHTKSSASLPNGHADQIRPPTKPQRTTTAPPFKRRLVSQHEVLTDRIEDERDPVAETPQESSPISGPNGAKGGRFTTLKLLPVPSSDGGTDEDDEHDEDAIARLPSPKPKPKPQPKPPEAGVGQTNGHRADLATNGVKRPPGEPDGLQGLHTSKRRPQPSSQADIPKTTFASAAAAVTQAASDALRVERAACEPCYVYPAAHGMREGDPGATNQRCYLFFVEDDPRIFQAVDGQGDSLNALDWILPKPSKVSKIMHNHNSPVVRLFKRFDYTAQFQTGMALTIQFASVDEARGYVQLLGGRVDGTTTYETPYE